MMLMVRPLAFFLALCIGLHTGELLSYLSTYFSLPDEVQVVEDRPLTRVAETPTGISILYSGTLSATSTTAEQLVFVVINGTEDPVTYFGYSSNQPFPLIRINGIDANENGDCNMWKERYTIKPGGSTEFRVEAGEFSLLPKVSQDVSIGIHLNVPADSAPGEYLSEPIVLPTPFRKAIRKQMLSRSSE